MKIGGSTAWRIITQPISDRSLFGVITGLRHVDLAHRFFRAISAWRSSHLSALRHGDPAHRYFRGIPAWRRGLLDGLRHGYLAHRFFRAISAWRIITQPISKRFLSGVITALRHGYLAQKAQRQPSAIPALSPPGKSVFYRMLADSGPFSWTSRCSLGAPVGLRHGDLAYRCFRSISAWRSSHLSALRHGDPCPEVSQRHPRVAKHPPTDLKTVSFRCHNRSSARRPCL